MPHGTLKVSMGDTMYYIGQKTFFSLYVPDGKILPQRYNSPFENYTNVDQD